MSENFKYRRVLLKLSGEALMGEGEYGIDLDTVERISADVKGVHEQGAEVCLVIGGVLQVPQPVWSALAPIIWACWQQLLMLWLCKMLLSNLVFRPV